jgi:tRNA dimethylallyltransferase
MQNQAIFLMGPTAVGKTALAMQLAQLLPIDIISVDSAMVYRGLDIGTGKPSKAELAQFPHRLIDICDPLQPYSVAQFCADANYAMQQIWQQQRIPLLVGGTMLYFKALQFGLAPLPAADATLRQHLSAEAQQFGWPHLHARLQKLDPETAARLAPHDAQRIQRALEINIISGKTLNDFFTQQHETTLNYEIKSFALLPKDRAVLHTTIAQRFMKMLEAGLLDEVTALRQRNDLNPELPAIRCVGYRQAWDYLDGNCDYETMCERAIAATRQLAKRQFTWLRTWPNITKLDNSSKNILDTIMKSVLDSSNN